MIGKVKKFLGIEGVKLELILPEEVLESDGIVEGQIRFQSMNPQEVVAIKIVLIERYARGRGKEKLVDEYELGSTAVEKRIVIPADEVVEVNFTLPFVIVHSEVDSFERRNLLFAGLARAAKLINNVDSAFRIEAEAKVKGTALNPFDRKPIVIKRR
ncbi:MAG: sporulation protein [Lewinellaceae bacterium]|nr:sporulation protein [Lewinellaceae bacterium]